MANRLVYYDGNRFQAHNSGITIDPETGTLIVETIRVTNNVIIEKEIIIRETSSTSIPTHTGNLLNNSGFITINDVPYIPSRLTDLRIADGSGGQFLQTDGAGNFFFTNPPGGDGEVVTPGDATIEMVAGTLLVGGGSFTTDQGTESTITFNLDESNINYSNISNLPTIPTHVSNLLDYSNYLEVTGDGGLLTNLQSSNNATIHLEAGTLLVGGGFFTTDQGTESTITFNLDESNINYSNISNLPTIPTHVSNLLDYSNYLEVTGDGGLLTNLQSSNNATIHLEAGTLLVGGGSFTTDQGTESTITFNLDESNINYSNISNLPTIPTHVSNLLDYSNYLEVTGDGGLLTNLQSSNNATIHLEAGTLLVGGGSFTTDQGTESTITLNLDESNINYSNISNLPTNVSEFRNDSNYATQNFVTGQGYATEIYVTTEISNLIDSAPGALNTLNELAQALGKDENFAATVTDSLSTKLNITGDGGFLTNVHSSNNATIQLEAGTLLVGGGSFTTDQGTESTITFNLDESNINYSNISNLPTIPTHVSNLLDYSNYLEVTGDGGLLTNVHSSNNAAIHLEAGTLLVGGGSFTTDQGTESTITFNLDESNINYSNISNLPTIPTHVSNLLDYSNYLEVTGDGGLLTNVHSSNNAAIHLEAGTLLVGGGSFTTDQGTESTITFNLDESNINYSNISNLPTIPTHVSNLLDYSNYLEVTGDGGLLTNVHSSNNAAIHLEAGTLLVGGGSFMTDQGTESTITFNLDESNINYSNISNLPTIPTHVSNLLDYSNYLEVTGDGGLLTNLHSSNNAAIHLEAGTLLVGGGSFTTDQGTESTITFNLDESNINYSNISNLPTIPTHVSNLLDYSNYLEVTGDGGLLTNLHSSNNAAIHLEAGTLLVGGGSFTTDQGTESTITFNLDESNINYSNISNLPTIPTHVSNLLDYSNYATQDYVNNEMPKNLFDVGIVDGSNGQFLKTDGAGNFMFANPPGGGGEVVTPGDATIEMVAGKLLVGGGSFTTDQGTDSTITFNMDESNINYSNISNLPTIPTHVSNLLDYSNYLEVTGDGGLLTNLQSSNNATIHLEAGTLLVGGGFFTTDQGTESTITFNLDESNINYSNISNLPTIPTHVSNLLDYSNYLEVTGDGGLLTNVHSSNNATIHLEAGTLLVGGGSFTTDQGTESTITFNLDESNINYSNISNLPTIPTHVSNLLDYSNYLEVTGDGGLLTNVHSSNNATIHLEAGTLLVGGGSFTTDQGTESTITFDVDKDALGVKTIIQNPNPPQVFDLLNATSRTLTSSVSTDALEDVEYSASGDKLFVMTNTQLREYPLSTPYTMPSSLPSITSTIAVGNHMRGISFDSTGTYFAFLRQNTDLLYIYECFTSFTLLDSTQLLTYNTNTNGGVNAPFCVSWCNNNYIFVGGSNGQTSRYVFDPNTDSVSYDNNTQDIAGFTMEGFKVSPDGTKIWIVNRGNDSIEEYALSTAYDITSIGSSELYDFELGSGGLGIIGINPTGLDFKNGNLIVSDDNSSQNELHHITIVNSSTQTLYPMLYDATQDTYNYETNLSYDASSDTLSVGTLNYITLNPPVAASANNATIELVAGTLLVGGGSFTTDQGTESTITFNLDESHINYSNLLNRPTIVSAFTNDSNYATQDFVTDQGYATQDFVTDQGYATQSFVTDQGYATQSFVTDQGYLTSANLTGYATQSFVTDQIDNLIDSAPGALNTLNELSAALDNDQNFATTVTTSLSTKLNITGDGGLLTNVHSSNNATIQLEAGTLLVGGGSFTTDQGADSTITFNLDESSINYSNISNLPTIPTHVSNLLDYSNYLEVTGDGGLLTNVHSSNNATIQLEAGTLLVGGGSFTTDQGADSTITFNLDESSINYSNISNLPTIPTHVSNLLDYSNYLEVTGDGGLLTNVHSSNNATIQLEAGTLLVGGGSFTTDQGADSTITFNLDESSINYSNLLNIPTLANVAISGAYEDLTGAPTIVQNPEIQYEVYDLLNATSITLQSHTNHGQSEDVEYSRNGDKLFVVKNGTLREYNLSTPYTLNSTDLSSHVNSRSYDNTSQAASGVSFDPTGMYYAVVTSANNRLYIYKSPSAYTINDDSTLHNLGMGLSSNGELSDCQGVSWTDKNYIFVVTADRTVAQYVVDYNKTPTYTGNKRTIYNDGSAGGLKVSPDGKKLWLALENRVKIVEFEFGTPYDIDTIASTGREVHFPSEVDSTNMAANRISPSGIDFKYGNLVLADTDGDGSELFHILIENENNSPPPYLVYPLLYDSNEETQYHYSNLVYDVNSNTLTVDTLNYITLNPPVEVSANNATIQLEAGTLLVGGGSFTTDQGTESIITFNLDESNINYSNLLNLPSNVSAFTNDSNYATQSFVTDQGYLTSANLTGYATQSFVTDQGYATQSFVTDQGYLTSANLTGYATQSFVTDQGYATQSFVTDQGYLTSANLTGYATQSFVTDQGYATQSFVTDQGYATQSFVTDQGYATQSFVTDQGYATQSFVTDQGYLTSANLTGYATQSFVTEQGYATQDFVTIQGYLTSANLTGYATESFVTDQIDNLIDSAPGALNTLNELAAALGDDENFATTVTDSLSTKLNIAGDGGLLTNVHSSNNATIELAAGTLLVGGGSFTTDQGTESTITFNLDESNINYSNLLNIPDLSSLTTTVNKDPQGVEVFDLLNAKSNTVISNCYIISQDVEYSSDGTKVFILTLPSLSEYTLTIPYTLPVTLPENNPDNEISSGGDGPSGLGVSFNPTGNYIVISRGFYRSSDGKWAGEIQIFKCEDSFSIVPGKVTLGHTLDLNESNETGRVPHGVSWTNNNYIFVLMENGTLERYKFDEITETISYDVNSAVIMPNVGFGTTDRTGKTFGLKVNRAGTKLWHTDINANSIKEYVFETPYDVKTIGSSIYELNLGAIDPALEGAYGNPFRPKGIDFKIGNLLVGEQLYQIYIDNPETYTFYPMIYTPIENTYNYQSNISYDIYRDILNIKSLNSEHFNIEDANERVVCSSNLHVDIIKPTDGNNDIELDALLRTNSIANDSLLITGDLMVRYTAYIDNIAGYTLSNPIEFKNDIQVSNIIARPQETHIYIGDHDESKIVDIKGTVYNNGTEIVFGEASTIDVSPTSIGSNYPLLFSLDGTDGQQSIGANSGFAYDAVNNSLIISTLTDVNSSTGTSGQILTKGASGLVWTDIPEQLQEPTTELTLFNAQYTSDPLTTTANIPLVIPRSYSDSDEQTSGNAYVSSHITIAPNGVLTVPGIETTAFRVSDSYGDIGQVLKRVNTVGGLEWAYDVEVSRSVYTSNLDGSGSGSNHPIVFMSNFTTDSSNFSSFYKDSRITYRPANGKLTTRIIDVEELRVDVIIDNTGSSGSGDQILAKDNLSNITWIDGPKQIYSVLAKSNDLTHRPVYICDSLGAGDGINYGVERDQYFTYSSGDRVLRVNGGTIKTDHFDGPVGVYAIGTLTGNFYPTFCEGGASTTQSTARTQYVDAGLKWIASDKTLEITNLKINGTSDFQSSEGNQMVYMKTLNTTNESTTLFLSSINPNTTQSGTISGITYGYSYALDCYGGTFQVYKYRIKIGTIYTNYFRVSSDGIYATTSGAAANMYISSSGLIHRSTSSIKYKTNVEDLQDEYADRVFDLRPVWFRSNPETISDTHAGEWSHYGLIAEEVAAVDKRLVHFAESEDGTLEPEGVQYDRIVPHLINIVKRQRTKIDSLEQRLVNALERIEALERS